MANEPSLEQLSTYVDGELSGPERAEVEAHLKSCSSCRARLDGIQQAANAIRALPMETPPRTFTVPAQRRQAWRWAPVGWATTAVAAVLVVAFGISQFHGSGSGGTTATSLALNRGVAQAPAAGSSPAPAALDSRTPGNPYQNLKTVPQPNGIRKLTVEADGFSYSVHGSMRLMVILEGGPSQSIVAKDQGLTVMLLHDGAGVELGSLVGVSSYNGTPVFARTYDLGSLPVGRAPAGDYQLVATWLVPDGSGQVLQAGIPVHLTPN